MTQAPASRNHFYFKEFGPGYLVTNDAGSFLFLTRQDFDRFARGEVAPGTPLYERLVAGGFLIPASDREYHLSALAARIRRARGYLLTGTQLHIFVLTTACNQTCAYCQASAGSAGHMTREVARHAVDIALSSPAPDLTFEFQGGEPLLNFPVLQFIVAYARERAAAAGRSLSFNLVANLTLLDDRMLDFLVANGLSVCTSLDGPADLHNQQRPLPAGDAFARVSDSIRRLNAAYRQRGLDSRVQALQTTTRPSLGRPRAIIDTYLELGFTSAFIRPLTPLGQAAANWASLGYTPAEFLAFYAQCLDYVDALRQQGVEFQEGHARLCLGRISGAAGLNYMELRSPCGGALGQLAYDWDGRVYTCDEGRMLAAAGDQSFGLGSVFTHDYAALIKNPVAYSVAAASLLEAVPGCSACAYAPYCGTCPVLNWRLQGSLCARPAGSYKCQIHRGLLDLCFQRLYNGRWRLEEQ